MLCEGVVWVGAGWCACFLWSLLLVVFVSCGLCPPCEGTLLHASPLKSNPSLSLRRFRYRFLFSFARSLFSVFVCLNMCVCMNIYEYTLTRIQRDM